MTTLATDGGLTIAEAAEATGLTTHTLRYYERDGLMLDAVERASSGHRRYTEQDLRWITLVSRAGAVTDGRRPDA